MCAYDDRGCDVEKQEVSAHTLLDFAAYLRVDVEFW